LMTIAMARRKITNCPRRSQDWIEKDSRMTNQKILLSPGIILKGRAMAMIAPLESSTGSQGLISTMDTQEVSYQMKRLTIASAKKF